MAIKAQLELKEKGIDVRVVSMPSWNRFDAQEQAYKDSVLLPNAKKRLGIEMAASFGWDRYVGDEGEILAIDIFDASSY